MSRSLRCFQDAFISALYQRTPKALAALVSQPGFSVYRNTVIKGCVDALCDNFPAVERLVGIEWLQAAAAVYAQQAPPSDARLICYGATFPDFLQSFGPARELPYLADVARLDRLWLEAYIAPPSPCLLLADLAGKSAEELAPCVLRPRACVRWRWFPEQPIYTFWRYNREERQLPDDILWRGEGALLLGHSTGVTWQPLEVGACTFLDACAGGHDLEHASARALDAQPDLDFGALLGQLLSASVFLPL